MTEQETPRAISDTQREHYRLWRSSDWVGAAKEAARISQHRGMRPVVRVDARFAPTTWRLDCDTVPSSGGINILDKTRHGPLDPASVNDSGLGINVVDWPYDRTIACDGSVSGKKAAWAWVSSTGMGMGSAISGTSRVAQPSHLAEAMALCQALLYAATFPTQRTVIITDCASLLVTKVELVGHLHKLAGHYKQLIGPLARLDKALAANPYDIDIAHVRSHRKPLHPAQAWNALADHVSARGADSGITDEANNKNLSLALGRVGLNQLVMIYPEINVTFHTDNQPSSRLVAT